MNPGYRFKGTSIKTGKTIEGDLIHNGDVVYIGTVDVSPEPEADDFNVEEVYSSTVRPASDTEEDRDKKFKDIQAFFEHVIGTFDVERENSDYPYEDEGDTMKRVAHEAANRFYNKYEK